MIAAIENGMRADLNAASAGGLLGYAWRTSETYPEEWDSYLKEKGDWKSPAHWAVFAGATDLRFTDIGNVRLSGAQFGLVVAAENLRNETATRHGGPDGAGEVGSYQLALDALAILSGSKLGLDIDPLRPRSMRLVRPFDALKDRKVSMIALQFETAFEITTLPAEADLDDFRTLHLDWDVPPLGVGRAGAIDGDPDEPGIQLPAPATGPGSADASDHLTLVQE
jgi:phage gp37-like protein